MDTSITSKDYTQTLATLKQRIHQAQYEALRIVNTQLIKLYWDIGKTIREKQDSEKWGDATVEQLSKDLQLEFPGIQGFSVRNLWNMRNFYSKYGTDEKLQPLVAEIGWTHNLIILEKCKKQVERLYYIKMTIQEGWSKRTLIDQIKSNSFESWAVQQTNFDDTLPKKQAHIAKQTIKDDYNFDFLLIGEEHEERDVEQGLIDNIVAFLAEMGGHFAFVGRQKKITVGEQEYYIDLLFYHRKLRCLVAVELKSEKFRPEYGGKMQFYLSGLDDQARLEGENPSIGIIICKEKDRTVVEYTLRDVQRPIGVGTYNHYSNLKDIPKEIAQYLPSETELVKRLGD